MPSEISRAATDEKPDVLEQVERAIALLEAHPDGTVREAAHALLQGIDAVHRAGLTHLVQAIHGMAGDAFLTRLTADPAIRLLLMSYNLIAVDRRLQAEEALDAVRGHLHDHGIDVEIVEVVGGVVYVRLHRSHPPDESVAALPEKAIRRDIEAALGDRFVGFQELVFRDRREVHADSQFVPLGVLRRANRPVYRDVCPAVEISPGSFRSATVQGAPVLVANVDGEFYAIANRCGDSPLPLEFGTLEGADLRCSWHGCLYDVRTGRRRDGQGGVQVFPVAVEDGVLRIAIDAQPAGGITDDAGAGGSIR